MGHKRTIQDLTFKDNFMFAATMLDPENCRMVLERILERPIARVEVSREKSIVYHPEYRGVRLDVYAKDEHNTHYDVEMQITTEKVLKRSRYYHDQMDMELIETGVGYEELPDSYVIFICDFDPLGLGKYRYTLKKSLLEDANYAYDDGVHTIILNTKGQNDDEVPEELVRFLHFVGAQQEDSAENAGDELIQKLQKSVQEIKNDRAMGGRYMLFEELLKEEHKEGVAEGMALGLSQGMSKIVLTTLSTYGVVPEGLATRIKAVTDENCLVELNKLAVKMGNIEAFAKAAETILAR